jgi:hypothetical protein
MKIDYFETLENPFLLDIEEKAEYTHSEYLEIQNQLEQKDINPFLESVYPEGEMNTSLSEMKRRINRGLYQKIVDPLDNTTPPQIQSFQIGNGGTGKRCFVCCTPLFSDRFHYSQRMLKSLEEVGYNGHFLLLNGGYPNPTGKEMKYVGVPYSFKVFMMMEANKRGFESIIWIDAACYAVNNPEYLFELVEKYDGIFRTFPPNCFQPNTCQNIVLPKTIDLLSKLSGRDIRNDINVNSIVFGLNFASSNIRQWVDEYCSMVRLGLPFLSEFPEEIVFTTLFNKPMYKYVLENVHESYMLYINEAYLDKRGARDRGYYFVQQRY